VAQGTRHQSHGPEARIGSRRRAGTRGRLAGRAAFLLVAALAAGCTIPEAHVGFDGNLEIFGPDARFPESGIPDDWATDGYSAWRLARDYVRTGTERGTPVLSVSPAPDDGYMLVRRVNAFLLTSPYFRWSWNMTPPENGEHPLRLAIGFFGGAPDSASRGGRPLVYLGTPLPPYDRVLALVWGEKALARGSVDIARPTPRYVARGGRENGGLWWTETVDLAQLYRRAWPKDDATRARIVFIGFAAPAADPALKGRFADIVLSR
jgi:hypothetical protein